jgi:hypothetical protein
MYVLNYVINIEIDLFCYILHKYIISVCNDKPAITFLTIKLSQRKEILIKQVFCEKKPNILLVLKILEENILKMVWESHAGSKNVDPLPPPMVTGISTSKLANQRRSRSRTSASSTDPAGYRRRLGHDMFGGGSLMINSATQTNKRESEAQTEPCTLVSAGGTDALASALLQSKKPQPVPDVAAMELLTVANGHLPLTEGQHLQRAHCLLEQKRDAESQLWRAAASYDGHPGQLAKAAVKAAEGRLRAEEDLREDWTLRLRQQRLLRLEAALDEFTADSRMAGRLRAEALRYG